ncbi:MAG: hypothetical protein K8U57_15360 [Planctomycetes bacterium]|nr:hypothetical protein [Planctomycetota bacterium]
MRLTTDDLPEIEDVTADQLEQILTEETFGKFAVLSASEEAFIQVACMWEPGEVSARFLRETGSTPFRLEYRAPAGDLLVADGHLTIAQITQAFLEYLHCDGSWKSRFTWSVVDD